MWPLSSLSQTFVFCIFAWLLQRSRVTASEPPCRPASEVTAQTAHWQQLRRNAAVQELQCNAAVQYCGAQLQRTAGVQRCQAAPSVKLARRASSAERGRRSSCSSHGREGVATVAAAMAERASQQMLQPWQRGRRNSCSSHGREGVAADAAAMAERASQQLQQPWQRGRRSRCCSHGREGVAAVAAAMAERASQHLLQPSRHEWPSAPPRATLPFSQAPRPHHFATRCLLCSLQRFESLVCGTGLCPASRIGELCENSAL